MLQIDESLVHLPRVSDRDLVQQLVQISVSLLMSSTPYPP
jgi:hypothetical protein